MPDLAARPRDGVWFFGLLGLYFALQVVLRLWASPFLELDEAALMMSARDFRAGYGGQLPLYEWIQTAAFRLGGASLATILVTKNLCLWATYALVFHAIRLFVPDRRAIVATLSLLLIPEISWEAQRTLSHSVGMILMTAATFAALARVFAFGHRRDYALLGVAIGLGGLSKFNYWVILAGLAITIVALPDLRRAIRPRLLALSAGIAALILALPLHWLITNTDRSLAASRKFGQDTTRIDGPAWLNALIESLDAIAAGLALLLLVLAILRWRAGRSRKIPSLPEPAERFRRLLLCAGLIGLAVMTVAMVATGATRVTPRWLVPMFMALAPALTLSALRADDGRAARWGLAVASVLALIILVAIPASRILTPSNISIDFAALHRALAPYGPEASYVLPRSHALGNLLSVAPEAYEPSLTPLPAGRPLLVVVPAGTEITPLLAAAGVSDPGALTATGSETVTVPDIVDPDIAHSYDLHRFAPLR